MTTATQSCWPRRLPPSICSVTGASNSASAPGGPSVSTTRRALTFHSPAIRVAAPRRGRTDPAKRSGRASRWYSPARHYRLDGLQLAPRPPRPLHLFIGGGGKSVLSLAGQHASSVGILARALPEGSGLDLQSDTLANVTTRVSWVRAAAGERFADIELALLFWDVAVTDDRESAAASLGGPRGLTPEQVLASPYFLIGSIDAMTEQVEALRARCGFSYFSVFPRDVDIFAPVVARLAGR